MRYNPISFGLVTQWHCFCLLKGRCLLSLLLMHLLSSVLLNTAVCHYICDFGILIKWQTWSNNVSPSNKLFLRAHSGLNTSFKWFFDVKNVVTFVKNARLPSRGKADKNVGQEYELVIRNRIIIICDVQHIRVLFGSVQNIWKIIWMWIRSPWLCPVPVHSAVSVH